MRGDLLYILAPSFSGSTLLTYLLAQHDDIATIGELKATQIGPVEEYRCSCGAAIVDCGFWSAVRERAAEHGIEFSLDDFGTIFKGNGALADKIARASVRGPAFERVRAVALRVMPGLARELDQVATRNVGLAKIICSLQGGRIFLDGSKDAARLLHFIRSGKWNVRVIYLQRDGRGVSTSMMSHGNLNYPEAVRQWRRAANELQAMRERLDEDTTFDLHYEELCNAPAESMHRIWQWLRIEPLEIQANQFKDGEFHILGNAMRLAAMSEIRLDEKWRTVLKDRDLQTFYEMAGHLNRQLGYA